MLRTLMKVRIQSYFASLFNKTMRKRQRSPIIKVLVAIFALYIIACFLGMFAGLFYSLVPICKAGYGWLYFALMGLVTFGLSFIMSVFAAQAGIFQAKDNDLLLSMPIPEGKILLSRFLLLLFLNMLYGLLVILPAGVIYALNMPVSAMNVVGFIACTLLLPLLTSALSCLVGGGFAWLDMRMKRKSLFTTALGVAFMLAYFVFISQANVYIERLMFNAADIAMKLSGALSPLYIFGAAIADGNVAALGVFALYAIIPFVAMYYLLKKNFMRIATTRGNASKAHYDVSSLKAGDVYSSLIKKELMHFSSSAMYMLNAGVGLVLMVAFAVMLILRRDLLEQILPMVGSASDSLLPAVVGLSLSTCTAMTFISAPSISLEGKTLWILQSVPVSGGEVLTAKADAHFYVTVPFCVLAWAICVIGLPMTNFMAVLAVLAAPLAMSLFVANLGVLINLKFPKFDWISEVTAVKQSASTIITMLFALGAVLLPALLYGFVLQEQVDVSEFMLLCSAIFVLLARLMRRWLRDKGALAFAKLNP